MKKSDVDKVSVLDLWLISGSHVGGGGGEQDSLQPHGVGEL